MAISILFIIVGLIYIFLLRTEWYEDYIKKHNFSDSEDFVIFIGNIVGGCFIFLGVIGCIVNLIN